MVKIESYSASEIKSGGINYGIYKYGRFVEFKVVADILTSTLSAYTKYTVGTIAKGFQPTLQLTKTIHILENVQTMLNITQTGIVELAPYAQYQKDIHL